MTKKKKIIIFAIIGTLIAGGITAFLLLHHKSSFKDNLKSEQNTTKKKKVEQDDTADRYFQLEEGGYYMICVDSDTAFLLIDRVDDEEIAGNYYPLVQGSDRVASHKFVIQAHRHTINLFLDQVEHIFTMNADKLGSILDQRTHRITDQEHNHYKVEIHPYSEPVFKLVNSDRYVKEIFSVQEEKDVTYGHANGYWTSFVGSEEESYAHIVSEGIKNTLSPKELNLEMDLYYPSNDTDSSGSQNSIRRPLILFLHGGAFYVGDKSDPAISDWCRHFAATGYVAASINYRMGFVPSKKDIERTGYMATQDAHAAMRFLVDKADKYLIDTNRIFVAGTSAGAITALNLAFMRIRPETAAGKPNRGNGMQANRQKNDKKVKNQRTTDLGAIQSTGNNLNNTFHILAVANMWGAVNNLNMLRNSPTAIISFHGDADQLVPYGQGYPFADISERLGRRLFDQMYGSQAITERAKELGLTAELHTFPGEGHALHLNADRSRNTKNFNFIRDHITTFFYRVMTPRPVHIESDPNNPRHYYVSNPDVQQASWKIQGGFIINLSPTEVWVVWRDDNRSGHLLSVTGTYSNGIPFNSQSKPKS